MKILLFFVVVCVGMFLSTPQVFAPSICPEDTNENNECVFFGTNTLMFPYDFFEEKSRYVVDENIVFELIESEIAIINLLNDTISQKIQNDNRNAFVIDRDNVWFNEILQRHALLMQDINDRLFGNFTNSKFGVNDYDQINYSGTHMSRIDNKILQDAITDEMNRADSQFCEKFGAFVNFQNIAPMNLTDVETILINNIDIEFGEYSDSDPCVNDINYEINISSKSPALFELLDLIKNWAEENSDIKDFDLLK